MLGERRLPEGITPRLLCREEAALYLGISPGHFDRHIAPLVRAVEIGKRLLWDIRALDRWIDTRAAPGDAAPDKKKLLGALNGNQDEGR